MDLNNVSSEFWKDELSIGNGVAWLIAFLTNYIIIFILLIHFDCRLDHFPLWAIGLSIGCLLQMLSIIVIGLVGFIFSPEKETDYLDQPLPVWSYIFSPGGWFCLLPIKFYYQEKFRKEVCQKEEKS